MKVSIIIAAYNAEKYLAETLESALHQTIDDYEVIAVDDGSTDSTLAILREYEQRYSQLHVIHQENGGPSAARNAGMAAAQGDFFFFLDGDDLVDSDSMEALWRRAEEQKADIVVAKYDIFNRYSAKTVDNLDEILELDQIDRYEPKLLWTFSLCNKLFRAEKIRQNHWIMPPVSYSEDGVFVMNYVFHADKITGLNKVVFHYRRMYDGETGSITSYVAPWKVRDYIAAHRMILQSIEENVMRDFTGEGSLEEIRDAHRDINEYFNEFLRKEVHILLSQFYNKFWTLDEDCIGMIAGHIREELELMDLRTIGRLQNIHQEIPLERIYTSHAEMLSDCLFTAVLYPDSETEDDFFKVLGSLEAQTLARIKIVVPAQMRPVIEERGAQQGNLVFVQAHTQQELFALALQQADTPYILFADSRISYTTNAFATVLHYGGRVQADLFIGSICHADYGTVQAIMRSKQALALYGEGGDVEEALRSDAATANKFFRTAFVRRITQQGVSPVKEQMAVYLKKALIRCIPEEVIVFSGRENDFPAYCGGEAGASVTEEKEQPYSLGDPVFAQEKARAYQKLQTLPGKTKFQRLVRKAVSIFSHLPIRNRVVFFSIRKDGELEGNAKALYPYVKGRKKIYARMLPHSKAYKLYMYYVTATAKVIVTDDYDRYLRGVGLRESQRVVQLWHACGAFKKFGQRGTNLKKATDLATHAQYNLVTVSGQDIRSIYADAFDVNQDKVLALGSPRTDMFFDEAYKTQVRRKVYAAHPELEGKEVLLYAPTFREGTSGRSVFTPELDFEALSRDLAEDQMLIICPHPVMKNDILPHPFGNIQVLRDFSTNDYMFISDMLITDYSSVIFEYVLLHKPIAFFCYDLAAYNRGFYLNYPDDLPGEVYRNQEELTDYLKCREKHYPDEKCERFIQRYMTACDGHSSERIAGVINRYMMRG